MSGGVDSSLAAYLLKKQGYAVTGVFIRSYNLDGCADEDGEYARRAAEHLKIPFYVFDFEEEYKKRVVEYMVEGYKKGITPNPDVMCNKEIKFDLFLREALAMGADYIATGHYIKIKDEKRKIQKNNSKLKITYRLFRAKDANKDQSYFLWTLTQKQLQHCLFPLGNYLKPKVREIAKRAGLPTWNKKDSQGVCFLGKVTLDEFLKNYIPPKQGDVRDENGILLGAHDGAWYYTIGQRHGLNLGNKNKELRITGERETKPHYVVSKDITTNTIVVAESDKNPALYTKEITLTNLHLINQKHSNILKNVGMFQMEILARVRYRQPLQKAILHCKLQIADCKLTFEEPQKFIAPGQSAVFYSKKGELLGGGIITA